MHILDWVSAPPRSNPLARRHPRLPEQDDAVYLLLEALLRQPLDRVGPRPSIRKVSVPEPAGGHRQHGWALSSRPSKSATQALGTTRPRAPLWIRMQQDRASAFSRTRKKLCQSAALSVAQEQSDDCQKRRHDVVGLVLMFRDWLRPPHLPAPRPGSRSGAIWTSWPALALSPCSLSPLNTPRFQFPSPISRRCQSGTVGASNAFR